MRLIDRLHEYLVFNGITAYAFENTCQVSNGYLGKQLKAKGSVGSDILERVKDNYTDLSLVWLVTGKGHMLLSPPASQNEHISSELKEEQQLYFTSKDEVIKLLNKQIAKLETTIADKEKIIQLLESELRQQKPRFR
jgi:hypothetical protein